MDIYVLVSTVNLSFTNKLDLLKVEKQNMKLKNGKLLNTKFVQRVSARLNPLNACLKILQLLTLLIIIIALPFYR